VRARAAAGAAAIALGAITAAAQQRFDLPDGPGRDLVYGNCQTCHDLQSVVDSAGIRRGAWDAVLDNMRDFGLRVTDDQRARILDYLATYLGPEPAPEPAATAAATPPDGAAVYADTCAACHGVDGAGKPGEFPPLAGNSDLFLSADFPVLVVLNGLEGPIEVSDQSVDKVMPSFGLLSDAEVAAVVGYVRAAWNNPEIGSATELGVTAADVAAARARDLAPADVHALRASLRP
jgi:mono/diheme cytochrome c family protein